MSFFPGPSNFQARINQPYMYTPQTQYYMPMNNIRNNINTSSNVDVTRLLSSATGEMLLQAGNQAYIQLQTEIWMLRNQRFGAQLTQRISDNNTLINAKLDALNVGTNDPAQAIIRRNAFLKYAFPLAHNHENIILNQQDYPAVKFWTAESFRSWLSQQSKGEKRVHHGEMSKKDYFLEDRNGNLVHYSTILSIRQYLRDAFARVKHQMPGLLAPSCGRVDQALLNAICHELRIMHPQLALCAHDWKVLDLLSRWYSHWNKKRPGRAEGEDYFSESDEDEQDSGGCTSPTGEASASNVSAAMKRGLPEEATLPDITMQMPRKRRGEPGSRRQKVTSSFEPRSTSSASILI
ncbi:hypothetical protein F5887DRAFT_675077 [Amanita rubescens]|nr:hypothetical protein F5887DRAFT_675077 [Amanita rubescens]